MNEAAEPVEAADAAAQSPAPAALRASGITVSLGGRTVLRNIDLSVSAGEIFGIFGPSGAGKSTLFRALAGEEPLVSGRVLLGDQDMTSLPLWKRARSGLGYLPQTPSVLWDLSVAENMAVYEHLAPNRADRAAVSAAAILDDLGLDGRLDVPAGALSGGERRRLELARALCGRPSVLLCDEPFAAIDPIGTQRVSDRLRRLAADGSAVIVADHNMSEALKVCSRAALLLGGEIVVVAPPEQFRAHERVSRYYTVVEGDRGDPSSGHPSREEH